MANIVHKYEELHIKLNSKSGLHYEMWSQNANYSCFSYQTLLKICNLSRKLQRVDHRMARPSTVPCRGWYPCARTPGSPSGPAVPTPTVGNSPGPAG